ncbi:MAG: hypothetical protein JXQ73_09705 [Phycisphaerae bacterium]|nr:hypothetical protein [Phycisphaerae bacterium]
MNRSNGIIVVIACVCGVACPALADFHDCFGDLQYCQDANDPNSYDPNAWDLDNPQWWTEVFMATTTSFSAQAGALELGSDSVNLYASSIGAYVDDGDHDANSSDTWFDSAGEFYLLTHVRWARDPNEPNDPNLNGAALSAICVDPNAWGCYGFVYNPRQGELILGSLTLASAAVAQLDYAVRGDVDPNDGVWMLLAHAVEGIDPNMPYTMRYTLGSKVTLTATPNPEKEFSYWRVLDPNFPGDANHGTTDSNTTLQLTMTQDTEVVGVFACGSGLSFVPLAVALQALVAWSFVLRRR